MNRLQSREIAEQFVYKAASTSYITEILVYILYSRSIIIFPQSVNSNKACKVIIYIYFVFRKYASSVTLVKKYKCHYVQNKQKLNRKEACVFSVRAMLGWIRIKNTPVHLALTKPL